MQKKIVSLDPKFGHYGTNTTISSGATYQEGTRGFRSPLLNQVTTYGRWEIIQTPKRFLFLDKLDTFPLKPLNKNPLCIMKKKLHRFWLQTCWYQRQPPELQQACLEPGQWCHYCQDDTMLLLPIPGTAAWQISAAPHPLPKHRPGETEQHLQRHKNWSPKRSSRTDYFSLSGCSQVGSKKLQQHGSQRALAKVPDVVGPTLP